MLTELYHYTTRVPRPSNALSTECTLKYLESCNKIFEKGFLSHEKIMNIDSEVLKNIDNGYMLFSNWLESLITKGIIFILLLVLYSHHNYFLFTDPKFNPLDNKKKHFLSWQSM